MSTQIQEELIEILTIKIEEVEKEILKIIYSNEAIKQNYKFLVSIKGVGMIIAVNTYPCEQLHLAHKVINEYVCSLN